MDDPTASARPDTGPSAPPPRRLTVMFCWGLGGGLGHLMQMAPLAAELTRRGHRVFAALRQLERAQSVFGKAGVKYLQAPAWSPAQGGSRKRRTFTFTQLLANVGFGDDGELFARACAWRNLLNFARPDVGLSIRPPGAVRHAGDIPPISYE